MSITWALFDLETELSMAECTRIELQLNGLAPWEAEQIKISCLRQFAGHNPVLKLSVLLYSLKIKLLRLLCVKSH